MLAIVCPGQGAQAPGMLRPWLELPGVAEHLAELSAAAGARRPIDLLAHGTESDADTIRDTAVAQPLIVAAGLVSLRAVLDGAPAGQADVLGGHSVGEFTAAAIGGVLTEAEAMALVAARGLAMAEASALAETGMSAVLGGEPMEVSAALGRLGLTPANVNAAGQVVAAGPLAALAELAAAPPAKARVVPLQVAGAFHTDFMATAVDPLTAAAAQVSPREPITRLLSNADGAIVTSGADALQRLIRQVANPVRWDLCTGTLAALGVTGLLELSPAGTLANLAKRGLPGVEIVALKTPEDLPAARALIAAHASAGAQPASTGGAA